MARLVLSGGKPFLSGRPFTAIGIGLDQTAIDGKALRRRQDPRPYNAAAPDRTDDGTNRFREKRPWRFFEKVE